MRGNATVRFCEHCNLSVHDLTAMTRADAERLVAESNGRLCARIYRREDRRLSASSAFVTIRRASRFAAGTFSAALAMGAAVAAHESPRGAGTPPVAAAAGGARDAAQRAGGGPGSIYGAVSDNEGAVIEGATVELADASGNGVATATTDEAGRYTFSDVPPGAYVVRMQAVGFVGAIMQDVVVGPGGGVSLDVTLDVRLAIGGAISIAPRSADLVGYYDEREALDVTDDANPPILEAVRTGDVKEVKAAIAKRSDLEARNVYGETALVAAGGDEAMVKVLLAAGANPNAEDRYGVTALMRAASDAGTKAARRLLDAGADANAHDSRGHTPLMVAAIDGELKAVKLLVDAGANVNARDYDGNCVLGYARESENEDVVAFLEKHGARE